MNLSFFVVVVVVVVVCVCVFGVSNAKNLAFDTLDVSALRAFTSGIYKKKLFYHLKNYFINFSTSFYNTLYIKSSILKLNHVKIKMKKPSYCTVVKKIVM